MFSYIEKLRKAPLKQRQDAAIMITGVIVAVIGLLWVISLGIRLNAPQDNGGTQNTPTPESTGIQSPY